MSNDTVKDGIKFWLVLEVLLIILFVGRYGLEGLAGIWCDVAQPDDDLCDELDAR
jgi:hypothetical protein